MEPSELAAKDTAFRSAVESNLIAGAVMGTTDESGDARIFATKLALIIFQIRRRQKKMSLPQFKRDIFINPYEFSIRPPNN